MKTANDYIRDQFLLANPTASNITVDHDDADETIRVVVTHHDDVKHYSMHVSSDDDAYVFTCDDDDNDDPSDELEFPFQIILVIDDDDLPITILAQQTFLIDNLTRCLTDHRLATMITDDDDYVPAMLRIFDKLLECKFDVSNPREHEIDLSNEPNYADALSPALMHLVKT